MLQKALAVILALAMVAALSVGCAKPQNVQTPASSVSAGPEAEPVTLVISGSWADCRALDITANAFTALYPNCTIAYEYLQEYYTSLEKRMQGEDQVDIFFTINIQEESPMLPYALDLNSREDLDLSDTFDGLIENFLYRDPDGNRSKLYAIPLGAEMRGLYVNVTLLKSLGLEVPTNQATLLECCRVLKENGYIPFHGNPGEFSQTLLYPWICNLIVNADDPQAAYARVDAREAGLSEMFREPYAFLYSLVENDYYDYKTAQTDLNLFNDNTDEAYVQYFLNIQDKDGTLTKVDDLGQVSFMPASLSLQTPMEKAKDDYHSGIDYVFIPAPVSPDGGFAYLSPAHGIAVNKDSADVDWCIKFLNFLFQSENNELFAEAFNAIPNTKEAFSYIRSLYDLPDDRICELGRVTFSYGFYALIRASLIDVSKANNPKYMKDDGSGNLSLYPLDYYMEELEASFHEE